MWTIDEVDNALERDSGGNFTVVFGTLKVELLYDRSKEGCACRGGSFVRVVAVSIYVDGEGGDDTGF